MTFSKSIGFMVVMACALANAQLMHQGRGKSVEISSASDENTRGRGNLQWNTGVEKAQWCITEESLNKPKVCDPDHLLSRSDKSLVKQALRELETLTSAQQLQNDQSQGGIKMNVLLVKNIQDTKDTDQKVYDMVKQHALTKPFDRIGVIVLSVGSDFGEQQRKTLQSDRQMNTPVYYNFPSGVWSNFYSTSTLNTLVHPSEIVELYSKVAPQLREGTYGVVLLDIIHGIRNKALVKQGKITSENQFNQQNLQQNLLRSNQQMTPSIGGGVFNMGEIQKVERCLQQFEGKVCDPDRVLYTGQKEQIDGALRDLEANTYVSEQQQTGQFGQFSSNCKKGGIKLATIIIRDVQNQASVDQKINDLLFQWSQIHPCDRTAVMMLSPSQQNFQQQNFGEQQVNFQQQPYYYRFPTGVWSKFYGIANLNVPVGSAEIVQLYDQEKPLIRQGEFTRALLNIIRGFKERAMSHRVTRQVNFDQQNQDSFKQVTSEEKYELLNQMEECLQNTQVKMCDPKQLLTDDEHERINTNLKQIETESYSGTTEDSKKKQFIVKVVMLPYMDDISEVERKINERLSYWRKEHLNTPSAIIMLSASKGDPYQRSKFYGTSTLDAPVRPHELIQFYNDQKLLIRPGKFSEALLNIIEKIRERYSVVISRSGNL